jgi:FAD/FMN-containing dehydrogenase
MKTRIEVVANASAEQLKANLKGELIGPDHPGYDSARAVWNARIDKRPALIARCTSETDVATCIQFARDEGVEVAIRGGGHSVAGHCLCEDGLVIDVSHMKMLETDANRRMARAGAGLTAGELLGRLGL